MRILIVSDTHRNNNTFLNLIEKIGPMDMVVHCGDAEGGEHLFSEASGCPFEIVRGNNDFFSNLPREKEFNILQYKVWLLHGHNYSVSMGYEYIRQEALEREVDIVMCGHTHRPVVLHEERFTIVNPGSLSYPRQENRKPSYVLMEIDSDGKAHYTVNYLT